MNSQRDHALALIARAKDDLYVVRSLARHSDAPGWVVGFHAQQAVEKALKAVLSAAGVEYPRTHNLTMLAESLRANSRPLPPDANDLGQLIPFGVVMRYEEFVSDVAPADVVWLEAVAARTVEWAVALVATGRS